MFADALLGTHNGTGGTGSLTLVRAKGCALPSDLPGLSGTIAVPYQASEYTDATWGTLLQYERGIATITLATGVLSSRAPSYTITAGGVILTGNPAALNFGNTAANFAIRFGDSAVTQSPALPALANVTSILNEPYTPANTRMQLDGGVTNLTMSAGGRYYIPVEYAFAKPITTVAVNAPSITTTGNVRISVYEWGADGLPGNLIKDFTSAAQIAIATATGIKSLTLAAPFWLPPGWYFFMVQPDAAVVLNSALPAGQCGIGSNNSRDGMYFFKSATYGAAPTVGDTTGMTAQTRSNGGQPVVYIK